MSDALSSCRQHTHTHRGLCTILRSAAGGQDRLVDDDDDDDAAAYKNNSHWLSNGVGGGGGGGENSNFVGYYDAASLYPSSGELRVDGGGGWLGWRGLGRC